GQRQPTAVLSPTESGGADQREKRKEDRSSGVGWRSDGGQRNTLARMMRQADPFAPGAGAPTTQGSSPVGAPPPVRTEQAPTTGFAAHSHPSRVLLQTQNATPTRRSTAPGANGVPSTPKCATPYRTRHGCSYKPKTRRPRVGAPPPVRTACPARPNASPHRPRPRYSHNPKRQKANSTAPTPPAL